MLTTATVELPLALVEVLEDVIRAGEGRGVGRWARSPGREYRRHQAATAQAVLTEGRCVSVHVRHDLPPATLSHEHGLLVLFPVDGDATHLLEILSVADDPRWALHEAGGLMRREWRWLRVPGIGTHGFAASGEPIDHADLGDFHGTELEVVLTEGDDGWPGDDATLGMSFDEAARLVAS
jgi:hypothetical protein